MSTCNPATRSSYRKARLKDYMLRISTVIVIGFVSSFVMAQQPTNPGELGAAPVTLEDTTRSNILSYGLSSAVAFDDNVQGSGGKQNILTSIQPQLGLSLNRPRIASALYYSPSYAFSTNVASQSVSSQVGGGQVTYLFSRRLSVNLRGSFVSTSNPIESINASLDLPQLGVLQRPNDSFVGATVKQTFERVAGDLSYRLGQYTSAGVGGTFSNTNYRTLNDTQVANEEARSRAWSAYSFLSHRLTPRYTIGFDYAAERFSSQQSISTMTHAPLGFVNMAVRPHVQLSVFAGPEFSFFQTSGSGASMMLPARTLSLSYGSTLSWQGEKNGLSVSFSQRVSDSIESSTAAVKARTVNFRADRQLTKRMTLGLFTNYITNETLTSIAGGSLPDSIVGGIGLQRQITQNISAGVSAFHQEFLSPSSVLSGLASHDVVSVSIGYNFARPIGR